MKKFLIYYSFVIVSVMTLVSFLKAQSSAHLISAIIFFPLFAYFIELVIPRRRKAIAIILPVKKELEKTSVTAKTVAKKGKTEEGEVVNEGVDNDRRVFLKIIASAGAGLFMMSIFTKKTHAAFFGSVPGPGTISVKDSTGAVIDPAIKTPTDGYKITEIADTTSPAYYGFVNKDGAWFIMKEDSTATPNYSYVKGTGLPGDTFAAKWLIKGTLGYDYFDVIFS
ncbi:hypothetical protein HZA76_00365 [Candidatus Roizmanbacteria bacterium]|nr:hypothetical protein [Candidatus Roizmanbacteria bacterium]